MFESLPRNHILKGTSSLARHRPPPSCNIFFKPPPPKDDDVICERPLIESEAETKIIFQYNKFIINFLSILEYPHRAATTLTAGK